DLHLNGQKLHIKMYLNPILLGNWRTYVRYRTKVRGNVVGTKSIVVSSEAFGGNQRQGNRPPPAENGNGISSLAHEINNPLESLHQLHYLIEKEGTLAEKGRQYLALAREEVQRISRILHAAMALRDSGDPEDTDLPELLGSVLNFYKSRFDSQGISVNARCRGKARISGYPQQLRQMCANLLLNAADAMPGGGKIYARLAPSREWKDQRRGLRLTFADTGTGIPAKNMARICDPFFTTKGAAGNGIGLSLVKNTVQKHHGVLLVRSSTKAGRSGTVFSIFLPCA
ncbi:MAG: HAMP domain-containing sensor histidine kinase, partial [Candidatus Angelobacter sp.]